MKDAQDPQAPIGVAIETLVRHISETSRNDLATLRSALDQQIASLEARLDPNSHQPAIDATIQILGRATAERIDQERQERQRAEATTSQVLAANSTLRAALDKAQLQLEAAQAAATVAEAERHTMAAQHREALNEKAKLAIAMDASRAQLLDVQAQLKVSRQEAELLAAERLDLQRRLKEITAARDAAEAHYQQIVIASQKLTDGLSQTLHRERAQVAATAPVPPVRTAPATPGAGSAQSNVLQFSGPARDAKRVKIRRGTHVTVDGIPGELVDLSIGGAQVVLQQLVKPNQLVRLALPSVGGQLSCKGRIVWALYEQPGTSLSVYRAGVKFSDADEVAVERFINDFREESVAPSQHSSAIA